MLTFTFGSAVATMVGVSVTYLSAVGVERALVYFGRQDLADSLNKLVQLGSITMGLGILYKLIKTILMMTF